MFDTELSEFRTVLLSSDCEHEYVIDVYKTGGGTVGNAYTGLWAVQATPMGSYDVEFETNYLETNTPKTHAEIAQIALDFWEAD